MKTAAFQKLIQRTLLDERDNQIERVDIIDESTVGVMATDGTRFLLEVEAVDE